MKPHFKDKLRSQFLESLSQMYQREVPNYAKFKSLIAKGNQEFLKNHPEEREKIAQGRGSFSSEAFKKLQLERHGAIRLGTKEELHFMGRLFACFGLEPVGYYDLSQAQLPVHSTAFRPIENQAFTHNPFRMFCSLLRIDLIESQSIKQKINQALSKRQIVNPALVRLIERIEKNEELDAKEANQFILETLTIFSWNSKAIVNQSTYDEFIQTHPLIADIASFSSIHINHLTPASLDIDLTHQELIEQGFDTKAIIEGPPRRKCPILLRQTAFNALAEPIIFSDESTRGQHRARFGEVEQRGAALTKKGIALYDSLLAEVNRQVDFNLNLKSKEQYNRILSDVFTAFPDSWEELRKQDLAYFEYTLMQPKDALVAQFDLDEMIAKGLVSYQPLVYQDFLPVSAAGIFRSNLGQMNKPNPVQNQSHSNQSEFEAALGKKVRDPFELYSQRQEQSIKKLKESSKGH